MYSRWFNVAVVLLWVVAMGWLLVEKVLPSLVVGEPPSHQRILAAQRDEPPAGWTLWWNSAPVGWALNQTSTNEQAQIEVRSLVHFDEVPLSKMIPRAFSSLIPHDSFLDRFQVDALSVLVFDTLGHVSRFESSVGTGSEAVVKIRGQVDGADLKVQVHFPDRTPTDLNLKVGNALMSNSLSPQSRLPGLRDGQEWTVETYSPLLAIAHAGQNTVPTEILYARVEGTSPLVWNGRQVDAWVVVFRGDPGSSLGGAGDVRGKMWVSPGEGVVLRQEVKVFNSAMTFVRQSDAEAGHLFRTHQRQLQSPQTVRGSPLGGKES